MYASVIALLATSGSTDHDEADCSIGAAHLNACLRVIGSDADISMGLLSKNLS